MAKPELNSLPECQPARSPVPAVVVWVYSGAASLLFVRLHLWLAGLEANHPLRDVNEVAGMKSQVVLGFALVENLRYIDRKSLLIRAAFLAGHLDIFSIGEVGEAPGAEDGLAQGENLVARNLLGPRLAH